MLYIDLGTNTSLKDKQVLADKINQLLDLSPIYLKPLYQPKSMYQYVLIDLELKRAYSLIFFIPKPKDKEISIQTIDEYLLLKLIGDDYEQTSL